MLKIAWVQTYCENIVSLIEIIYKNIWECRKTYFNFKTTWSMCTFLLWRFARPWAKVTQQRLPPTTLRLYSSMFFFVILTRFFLLTIFKYLNKILSTSWGSNRLWILCWFQHMQPWAKKTRFYFGNKIIFISLFGIFLIPIWDSQIRFFSQAYRVQLSFVNKKNEIQLLGISWWK